MSISSIIKESGKVMKEGFSYHDMTTMRILTTLMIAYLIAMYIHLVYKYATKNAFYYKNYGISMTIMSVVTAGIIMAMQSSLVISLGMVGALSIVRFRTAIKDPLDLLFLFWSISIGIITGAGLYELAIIVSLVATMGIVVFQLMPIRKDTYLLVLNASTGKIMDLILQAFKEYRVMYTVKAKNIGRDGLELICEIKIKNNDEAFVEALLKIEGVEAVHLLENDVDVKA